MLHYEMFPVFSPKKLFNSAELFMNEDLAYVLAQQKKP